MKPEINEKFKAFAKGKSAPEESDDMSDDDSSDMESSPIYDLACRLCDALGVSDDKADQVADILSELKSSEE